MGQRYEGYGALIHDAQRQIHVSTIVRRLLREWGISGLTSHVALAAVNRQMGLHVDHQDITTIALDVLARHDPSKDRYYSLEGSGNLDQNRDTP